jgi:cysteine desulfurase
MSVYFDHNATTPVLPQVFEAMRPFLSPDGAFGNPSSLHASGQRAHAALEAAREAVAGFFGAADPSEIIFTSSATEADNMAVVGAAFRHRDKGRRLVVSSVEHHAVLQACDYLEERHGFAVTRLPVDAEGRVSPDRVAQAVDDDTILVAVMTANNETGVIQPVADIGRVCRARGVLFFTDAVQAAGKIPVDLKTWPVDMAAISGHKMYAPKGIGALYVRRGVRLDALLHGGAHEKKRRAGTENVAGAVALGAASTAMQNDLSTEIPRVRALRDRLEQGLLARVPKACVNGAGAERVGNTLNIAFPGLDGESLVLGLDQAGFALRRPDTPGLELSTGSACSSGLSEPSHVLTAMGLAAPLLRGSVRFSLGRTNTDADVDVALNVVPRVVERLRALSPAWEDI